MLREHIQDQGVSEEGFHRVPDGALELIKTDWSEVKTDISDKGGVWTLKTPEYSLAINKKTGVMTVKDAKGGKVIREVRFLPEKEGLCGEMRSFINEKYADLKVADNGGGIIGDDNGKFGEVDKHEIPAADAVSILSISMEDGERFYGGGSTSRDHIQHRANSSGCGRLTSRPRYRCRS